MDRARGSAAVSGPARIIFDTGREVRLGPGDEQGLPENQGFTLEGLDAGSPVGIRLIGEDAYRDFVTADQDGRATRTSRQTLPQQLGIHMRGGETFELRCYADGQAIEFLLDVTRNLYTREQVDAMLEDLRSMEYAWDARSPVPTRVGDLERRVRAVVEAYPVAAAAAREVFDQPDEVLQHQQMVIPVRDARRMSARDVRTNLARRALDAHGSPVASTIVATIDVASHDTAANAYAAERLTHANAQLDELLRQLDLEDRRLAREATREGRYRGSTSRVGVSEAAIRELRTRATALMDELRSLRRQAAPRPWRAFRARPSASANMVRFDPRFVRLTQSVAKMTRMADGGRDSRLQRIAEFGRRPHSEIFETWAVAKAVEALYRLGFRVANDGNARDHMEAFVQLEDRGGATYGLRRGASVALRHKDADHLFVRVGYEPPVEVKKNHVRTPDIMMVLRGGHEHRSRAYFDGERYRTDPLYLDAKYRTNDFVDGEHAAGPIKKYLEVRHRNGQREPLRPYSFLVQARGTPFTWSQRRSVGDDDALRALGFDGMLEAKAVFPYRVGVATIAPDAHGSDALGDEAPMHPLVRIIYTWLVTQGVVAICPRCGSGMEPGRQEGREKAKHSAFKPYRPQAGAGALRPAPRKRHLECRSCDLGVTVNYCDTCVRDEVFVPIVKMYRHAERPDEAAKPAWIRDYEIAAPTDRRQLRHCPRCGHSPRFG
jgi:hypothetical protein